MSDRQEQTGTPKKSWKMTYLRPRLPKRESNLGKKKGWNAVI